MRPNIFKSRKNRLLLREVLREYMEDEAKVLPSLYQPSAYFSPEYEAHMQKLIKKQQKIYTMPGCRSGCVYSFLAVDAASGWIFMVAVLSRFYGYRGTCAYGRNI